MFYLLTKSMAWNVKCKIMCQYLLFAIAIYNFILVFLCQNYIPQQ